VRIKFERASQQADRVVIRGSLQHVPGAVQRTSKSLTADMLICFLCPLNLLTKKVTAAKDRGKLPMRISSCCNFISCHASGSI
jgi:hypothetical protein